MFEITISTAIKKSKDISFIINRLRPKIKSIKAIMVCEDFDGRINLAFATHESNKDLLVSLIFDVVCEAVIRSYKEEVFNEHINIKNLDEVTLRTFIKALTMFDKASDKDLIKSKLSLSNTINLDSFYLFKLWELKKRWVNIAELITENSGYLIGSGTFNDLMKFLITTNEIEFGELYLNIENGKIFAKSKDGAEIFNISYESDNNCKIRLVSEIISLSPQKIVLNKEFIGLEIAEYLTFLYEEKISVLKWKILKINVDRISF